MDSTLEEGPGDEEWLTAIFAGYDSSLGDILPFDQDLVLSENWSEEE